MAEVTTISKPSLMFSDLMKPECAAQTLGISKTHLRALTIAKRIPAIDFGKAGKHMFRYHKPTLDRWILAETEKTA